jgi:phosphoglycolate phosphatase
MSFYRELKLIKNIIFDLDGTLLDTSKGILESIRYTLIEMKLPQCSEEELQSFIGPPLLQSFVKYCGCTKDRAKEAVKIFRAYYQTGPIFHAELYDGVQNLCSLLVNDGMRMGVATNKPQRFASAILKAFELDSYFISICGADDDGTLKKSDIITNCLKIIGGKPNETVLIGDTINDASGALQVGIHFLPVTFGFGFKKHEDLKGVKYLAIADTSMQIADYISALNTEKRSED